MKALLLFSTILLNFSATDLPKLNSPEFLEGKCIKANPFHNHDFEDADSNDLVVVPHVHFEANPGSYQVKTVVIDPGHGGHDPGCLGANSREKHIALAIGKIVADGIQAEHPDVNVIMTRSTDVFVPLHERAGIATRNKADLFISIHCNAFSKSHANGIETYVLGLHATEANLEVAKRENEAILLEENYQETYGYDPNSTEAHITMSMFQNAFLEQSISFAEKVQTNAVTETGRKDRGVKQAGFLVLRHATMPSVLVETGYLTNRTDENYLITNKGQKEMAQSILNAFGDYKFEMENGTSAASVPTAKLPERRVNPVVASQGSLPAPPAKEEAPQVVKVKNETPVTVKKSAPKPKRKVALSIAPPPKDESKAEPETYKPYEPSASSEPSYSSTNKSPKRSSKIIATEPVAPPPTKMEKVNPQPSREETTIEPAVIFCVQLAASPKLLNVESGKWARLGHTVEVIKEGSLYKYQIRPYDSLESAESVRKSIRSKGFSDAFIVAYKGGEKIDPRRLK